MPLDVNVEGQTEQVFEKIKKERGRAEQDAAPLGELNADKF